MHIGLSAFLTEKSGPIGKIAQEAETLGFESFWMPEHMVMPVRYDFRYARTEDGSIPESFAHLPDPFIGLGFVAQATRHIKIATGICILPQRNVIATAKAAATLDFYSDGRLLLGVGAGWFPDEARIMNVDFVRRWGVLRETAEAIKKLWQEEEAEYQGEFIRFPRVRLFPKPVQKPHPPIHLGVHDPKYAPKRVARYADGWCPGDLPAMEAKGAVSTVKHAVESNGRDPEDIDFSVFLTPGDHTPTRADMERYRDAGVRRLVLRLLGGSDGVAAVQALARFVELGRRVGNGAGG